MSAPGDLTYVGIGQREDLSDIIYNISPTETPFMTMCGRGRATAVRHDWQKDSLVAVDLGNALDEGADVTPATSIQTQRLFNRLQISGKDVQISGTYEAVDKAGRKSELAYQIMKKGKELKRDMESILTQNQGSDPGSATLADPRVLGALESWITNTDDANPPVGTAAAGSGRVNREFGDDGADGGFDGSEVTAPVDDGTLVRALTEGMLKGVIKAVWNLGGDPSTIMCGPTNKQNISAFTGNVTRFDRSEDKRLVTAIDIYVSDFGEHRIVPNRFSRDRTVFVLTPRMWSVDYLRSFRQWELSKSGDSEKRQLLAEYTLRSSNETASGLIADLTPGVPAP